MKVQDAANGSSLYVHVNMGDDGNVARVTPSAITGPPDTPHMLCLGFGLQLPIA